MVHILFQAVVVLFASYSNMNIPKKRESYVGAVVEYEPVKHGAPADILRENTYNYVKFIVEAKNQLADIIVFPEYGLTTLDLPINSKDAELFLLPVPEIGEIPCISQIGKYEVLHILSCSARNNRIYVVVNIGEISTNGNYNTNVVFDRNGQIIARYRKHNLYFEKHFVPPEVPESVAFKTDFDVTFGIFTCFDVIFYYPPVYHVENGLQNFIFTAAWVDELPFLTAMQAGNQWAMAASSNLLMAGYHRPLNGQLGSGIFSGSAGPLAYTYDPSSGSRLIVSEIPIKPGMVQPPKFRQKLKKEFVGEQFFLKENLGGFFTKILENNSSNVSTCSDMLCCHLYYSFAQKPITGLKSYRLVAFSGYREVAANTSRFGWEVCGVIRCTGDTMERCLDSIEDDDNLESLPNFNLFRLTTSFTKINSTYSIMKPSLSMLDVNFQPIPNDYFRFQNEFNGKVELSSSNLQNITIRTIAMIRRFY